LQLSLERDHFESQGIEAAFVSTLEQCQARKQTNKQTVRHACADLSRGPLRPIVSGAHVQCLVAISIAIADMELVPAIRNFDKAATSPSEGVFISHGAMNNQALINQMHDPGECKIFIKS
jgi:hypothetical protein